MLATEKSNRLRSWIAVGLGSAAVLVELLMIVIGGSQTPGYSHMDQYISELSQRGAPCQDWMNYAGMLPVGILVLSFLWAVRPFLIWNRRTWLGWLALAGVGVGYIVAAFTPCDCGCPFSGSTSQDIHTAIGFYHYGGAAAGLLLFGLSFRQSPRWKPLRAVTLTASVLAWIGGPGMLLVDPYKGLLQRIAEAAFFGWVLLICCLLPTKRLLPLRRKRKNPHRVVRRALNSSQKISCSSNSSGRLVMAGGHTLNSGSSMLFSSAYSCI